MIASLDSAEVGRDGSPLPVQFTLVAEPLLVYPGLQTHSIAPVASSRVHTELTLQPPLSIKQMSEEEGHRSSLPISSAAFSVPVQTTLDAEPVFA